MPDRASALLVALACLLAGCGGAKTGPAAPPIGSGSPAPDPAAAPASRPAEGKVTITEVRGTPGATMKVTLVFESTGGADCSVPKYTLTWPGGSKTITVDDLVIPAGQSRQRSVKVHPDDGDITTLEMTTARVELAPCAVVK